jgi:2'-5' RNA ligase
MKYLKLKTIEELPFFSKDNKQRQGHITLAYFGEIDTNKEHIITVFSEIKPFVIRKIRPDLFGKDKTIPVVVYEMTEKPLEKEVHDARLSILQAYDVLDQNFANWVPHMSSVDFNESPDIIHVIGIEADDKSMFIDLTK